MLLNTDSDKIFTLTKNYSNFKSFIDNASEEELKEFNSLIVKNPLEPSTLRKLQNVREEYKVEELKRRFIEVNISYITKDKTMLRTGCVDDCLFDSHEIWFDIYMSTGNEVLADGYSYMYHAGCLNGCTYGM